MFNDLFYMKSFLANQGNSDYTSALFKFRVEHNIPKLVVGSVV